MVITLSGRCCFVLSGVDEAVEAALWSQQYVGSGSVTLSGGPLNLVSREFCVPKVVVSNYTTPRNAWVLYGDGDDYPGMGILLGLASSDGASVDGFAVVTPTEKGTTTYSYATVAPVTWLGLAERARSTGVLTSGGDISIERIAHRSWSIEVNRAESARRGFSTVKVTIAASSPTPPFEEIRIELAAAGSAGELDGRLFLSRE